MGMNGYIRTSSTGGSICDNVFEWADWSKVGVILGFSLIVPSSVTLCSLIPSFHTPFHWGMIFAFSLMFQNLWLTYFWIYGAKNNRSRYMVPALVFWTLLLVAEAFVLIAKRRTMGAVHPVYFVIGVLLYPVFILSLCSAKRKTASVELFGESEHWRDLGLLMGCLMILPSTILTLPIHWNNNSYRISLLSDFMLFLNCGMDILWILGLKTYKWTLMMAAMVYWAILTAIECRAIVDILIGEYGRFHEPLTSHFIVLISSISLYAICIFIFIRLRSYAIRHGPTPVPTVSYQVNNQNTAAATELINIRAN